jgi:glutamate synthase (NADPH/NADH) small chain
VVGSGPAGLACAQQLARAGHDRLLYEKEDRIGGLLRYGIPDFKLAKTLIDRRMAQMRAEGVEFHTHCHIGVDKPVDQALQRLRRRRARRRQRKPRDLDVPGRSSTASTSPWTSCAPTPSACRASTSPTTDFISAEGKHVVVIGGGDTGSDCIGTSNRHGARSVTQIEILDKPPEKEDKGLTWPNWPNKLRTCAVASRWWSGPFVKAVRQRAPSTSS